MCRIQYNLIKNIHGYVRRYWDIGKVLAIDKS